MTVGTHEPFDRLVRAVDAWAGGGGRAHAAGIVGQITARAGYRPAHFAWTGTLSPAEHRARVDRARLIVAHAGMGSIIGALAAGKPIVIVPRRVALRETRNDHQVGTVERFRSRPGVIACRDENDIAPALDRWTAREPDAEEASAPIGAEASPELLAAIRAFVMGR